MIFSRIDRFEAIPNGITAYCGSASLWVEFVDAHTLRIRFLPSGIWRQEETFVVEAVPETAIGVSVSETAEHIAMTNGNVDVTLGRNPFTMCVMDKCGNIVFNTAANGFEAKEGCVVQRMEFSRDERIYGLGQGAFSRLDLRGLERRMWHEWRIGRHSGPAGIPFMLSSRGYGLLLNASWPSRFVIGEGKLAPLPNLERSAKSAAAPWPGDQPSGEEDPKRISLILDNDQLDCFLVVDSDFDELLRGYAQLTGHAPMPPKWALGYIQSRNRYRSQDEILQIARGYRRRGLPCDVVVIDWLWFETFGDLRWDREKWPDPKGMSRELASMGFRLLQAQHPYVDEDAQTWDEFSDSHYLVEYSDEMKKLCGHGGHDSIFDHSNPEARKAWWREVERLFDDGIRGYWIDMGEPAAHPVGSVHHLGPREQVHNIYSNLWAKTLYDGQRSYTNERVFSLSRAAYAGIQRYGAALWSGDIEPSWDVLRDQVVIGQQVCLSGLPYWGTDIGAYVETDFFDPELYVRWLQWGVFCPLFRTHGKRSANEPWSVGPDIESTIVKFIRLRYTLMPYIYSMARVTHETGLPMMRAMALAFPGDEIAARNDTEFMFGPNMLVAPVIVQGDRARDVYLPQGTWYDWWTGERHEGGCTINAFAPLDRIPLFVKAGSIIPVGPDMLHANERPLDPMALHIYPGENGEFDLYEDDGLTYEYEKGMYAKTHVSYVDHANSLVISPAEGEYDGQLHMRSYVAILHDSCQPKRVLVNGKTYSDWEYDSISRTLTVPVGHRPVTEILVMQIVPMVGSCQSQELTKVHNCSRQSIWIDVSRPGPADATIYAYLSCREKPEDITWEIVPPMGWSTVSDPTASNRESDGVLITVWNLKAVGPVYTTANEVQVIARSGSRVWDCTTRLTPAMCTHWHLIGPFDNHECQGLDTILEPERSVDLEAVYVGKGNREVAWKRHDGLDTVGYVNIMNVLYRDGVDAFGEGEYAVMYGVAYASSSIWCPDDRIAKLEITGEDRFKVWVNGELALLASDPPTAIPAVGVVHLKKGWNTVLVKSSQDGTREWGGRRWGFYMRILNRNGNNMDNLILDANWRE